MALLTPNFDDVADDIRPGTYRVRVKNGEVKEWTNGGQYVEWELETIGEAESKNNGRRIRHKTSTSGRGAFVLQQFYRAAMGTALTGQFDTEQLIGRELAVEMVDGVNRQTGEATGYTEVKRVKPINA